MQTYLTFGQLPKIDALLAKLKDFNERVSNEIKMTTEQIDRLVQLVSAGNHYGMNQMVENSIFREHSP